MMMSADSRQPTDGESHAPPTPRRALGRWQFSLRGLLLFVLLTSMAMSLFVTARRWRHAEAELADYRQEYGILNVEENPTKLQAVARWTEKGSYQWKWRVYFPPGKYELCSSTYDIPGNGFPHGFPQGPKFGDRQEPDGRCYISSRSQPFHGDIAAALYKDPGDGAPKLRLSSSYDSDSGSESSESISSVGSLIVGDQSELDISGVRWSDDATAVSPEAPLVLLNASPVLSGLPDNQRWNGLMIWIHRVDEAKGGPQSAGK
jgi:hypothetical protein